MREIVIDTETTGLDYKTGDRIIEVGCVELKNYVPTGNTLQFYCKPDRSISEGAKNIVGLSDDFLNQQKPFEENGGSIDLVTPPLAEDLACQLHQLLTKSAVNNRRHHDLAVPFEDVQIHREAFLTQQQHVLVAKVSERPVGFFGFFSNGDVMHQCHGGFDYDLTLKTKAYHNVMNGAIQHAIEEGYSRVTFGPLNNETKRRIGTEFAPVNAHLWSREKLVGIMSKLLFIPNFQVYCGPAVTDPS